jgi:hypothetical protein
VPPTADPRGRSDCERRLSPEISLHALARYAEWMTMGEATGRLQRLPRETELLAMEPGCEEYCEREVEWQGGRVYLHLGARRDDPPRR